MSERLSSPSEIPERQKLESRKRELQATIRRHNRSWHEAKDEAAKQALEFTLIELRGELSGVEAQLAALDYKGKEDEL